MSAIRPQHHRFASFFLALALVFSFGFLAPRGEFFPHAAADEAADAVGDLEGGGLGLRIPVDQSSVKLSTDIVQDRSFATVVISIVNYAIGFLGLIATIVFIYGGVLMVISAGEEENVTKGRKMMTYAAIGILIIILSYSAVRFITQAADENPPVSSGPAGAGSPEAPAGESEQGTPAFQDQIDALDERMDGLEQDVRDLGEEVRQLPKATRDEVEKVIKAINAKNPSSVKDAIQAVKKLMESTTDPKAQATLQKLLDVLTDYSYLQEMLIALRDTMPESALTLKLYDETMTALEDLIEDPDNPLKFKRFNEKYAALKEAIRVFPVVSVKILAVPAEGNVPMTVTFDALGSRDPTGGTISQYRWTYLDSKGSEVSLGGDPVVTATFKDPNTYSVKLRASTSNVDKDGYKTAADGVAFVRVVARPPATQVRLRINGKRATDVYHATIEEAQAGLSLDPSESTPAVGRVIEKYEWSFGDGSTEDRSTPTSVVHSYSKPGDYFIRLTTIDNQKERDNLVIKLSVKSVAADINITPEEGDVNTEFRFQGIDSRSDDGVIDRYEWTVYDSKQQVVAESEKQILKHRFVKPGDYQVVLLVTDTNRKQDKVLTTMKVSSRAPMASFDVSIPEANHPNRVRFNGTGSYDLDEGDALAYSWDFDGDGVYEIVDSADPNASFEYKKVGDFKVKLQVKDQFGGVGSLEKSVSIASILGADIEVDHRVARVGDKVTFRVTSDTAVAYFWEFGDGETENTEAKEVTHVYKKKGKYTVQLMFFSQDDDENKVTTRVLIGDGDKPVAAIDVAVNGHLVESTTDLCGKDKSGLEVFRSDTLAFSARNSINIDGSNRMLLYEWELGDGTRNSRKEFNHRYSDLNIGKECTAVRLAVKDQTSGALSEDAVFYVRVINQLPQLTDFVVQPPREGELLTPVKIQLKAIVARDPDGNIKKYRWWYYREGREDDRLGLHNTSSSMTEMVVTASGEPDVTETYHFVLEMIDNDNGIYNTEDRFRDLSALKIKNGPNLSPVADFKMDKTTIRVGDSVTLVSTSYDPQGDLLPADAFKWDFDGDGTFDDTSSGPQVNRKYNTPGEYGIRLKVTHRGLSSSASHTVFVEPTQQLPQAAFTYIVSGNDVAFDAGTSRYDDSLADKTLRYEWDFDVQSDSNGNGTKDDDVESTEKAARHTYSDKGIYQVRLKVKDSQGQEGVVVREIDLGLSEEQRKASASQSPRVKALTLPLTTLELSVTPADLKKGDTAEVTATVMNADNEPYEGEVFFEIAEGGGAVSPSPAKAQGSKATALYTASDKGRVKLRVRATGATYGDLAEEIELNVR